MDRCLTRRAVFSAPLGVPLGVASLLNLSPLLAEEALEPPAVHPSFPAQDPQRVYDVVLYAHSDIDRVRKLVSGSPALANATIDWGFGDWESAIGAAAHMGRRDIAELLLEHGARPDLFTHAMLGNVAAVRAAVEAQPGVQGIDGPHGITLLAHAKAGAEAAREVVTYLESIGGADPSAQAKPLERPAADYVGTYAWSAAPGDRFEVTEGSRGLGLKRGEGFPRGLVHLGQGEFYPGGARAVRVRFTADASGIRRATVLDAEFQLVAERVAPTP